MDVKTMVKGILVGKCKKAENPDKDGKPYYYVTLDYMGGNVQLTCRLPSVPEVGKLIDCIIDGPLSTASFGPKYRPGVHILSEIIMHSITKG